MKDNIVEKHFQHKRNTLISGTLIILNHIFKEQAKWKNELKLCSTYYYNNFVLNNNINQKLIRKYYKFFLEFKIEDLLMRKIMISFFETIIDYKSLNNQVSKNGAILVGKIFLISIHLDKLSNSFEKITMTPKQIITELINLFPDDNLINNALKESKKDLILLIKNNLSKNKKTIKYLENNDFQLEFIPYKGRENQKPLYEVIFKYNIEGLSKYQSKEIEFVVENEGIDLKMMFVSYTLATIAMIRLIEKEKHVFFLFSLPNKFFDKKKSFKELAKLVSCPEFHNRIILEIDASIFINMKEEIEKVRDKGNLIAVRNGNPDLDPNYFDCIVIKDSQMKNKEQFKRFGKLGQITIISDVKNEEEQRKIDYHINNDIVKLKDIIEKQVN